MYFVQEFVFFLVCPYSSSLSSSQDLTERLRRLQVERESLESKMEAEKHVMRAQLRDLMEKQQAEVQRMTEQHQAQVNQVQQDLLGQLEELRKASLAAPTASQEASGSGNTLTDTASIQRIAELEGWFFSCIMFSFQSSCLRNAEEILLCLRMDGS